MNPSVRKLDAIVVLGCKVGPDPGSLSAPAARRADRGAHAFHEGLSERIVVAGGRRWNGVQEAEALASRLLSLGVPESAVLREDRSLTTAENARFTAELLAALGARHVGVVTCDWHLPRAMFLFTRAGLFPSAIAAESPRVSFSKRLSRGAYEYGKWCLDHAVTLTW
jgi:uncharacterized SAM-binding protein YcdF (DUF218 family)